MNVTIDIELKCSNCNEVVAKRSGNLLFTEGQLMTLFEGGFVFPCKCGTPYYFEYRKCGMLPKKRDVNGGMMRAA